MGLSLIGTVFFGEEAEVSGPEGFMEWGFKGWVGLGQVSQMGFFGFFGLVGFVWLAGSGWAMITLVLGGLLFRRGWERGFGGGWVGGGGRGGERGGWEEGGWGGRGGDREVV